MSKILKKCELFPFEIIPFLKNRGLLESCSNEPSPSSIDGKIRGKLCTDSRHISPGDIFLAYKGVAADGHLYIDSAIQRGASFIIVEDVAYLQTLENKAKVPWAQVQNGRAVWAELASKAFDYPQNSLKILGVTGTNGKTSTVWMTAEILRQYGIPCLTIGTLGARLGDEEFPTSHTTPDPDTLFSLLHLAKERGVKVVAMEVSSHALLQEKVRCLTFSGCAFTSFSRDHLDFHPTMDAYWEAKWLLFSRHTAKDAPCFFADVLADRLKNQTLENRSTIYGFNAYQSSRELHSTAYVEILTTPPSSTGTKLTLRQNGHEVTATTDFFAKHAIENLTAAALLASVITGEIPTSAILSNVKPVPGRLEPVKSMKGPRVIVDYAHTPDALEKTLQVLRTVCEGRLIVVFGCGGDRDPGKRPMMGRIAADNADLVYVTSDNPRTEDPIFIIERILAGIPEEVSAFIFPDREEAIHKAIHSAARQDIILIAGKGHENYQIIADKTLYFDDRKVAQKALLSWGNHPC